MGAIEEARPLRPVTIALEGGGSLGAFSWGVLERLLEAPLRIEVVSGASAGAMNAAMLVQGLALSGPEGARQQLEAFWRRVAHDSRSLALDFGGWVGVAGLFMVETMRRNGFGATPAFMVNPLRAILDDLLQPPAFLQPHAPRIVVSTTRVRTGDSRLFTNAELSVDALLASSCLPTLFPAVQIDGEAYWDGGFSSNPPLRPLIEAGAPADVIIVRTTPLERPEVPSTAGEVKERTLELVFGSALRQELRSLLVAQHLLRNLPYVPSPLKRLKDARVHMIGADAEFRSLPAGSHLDTAWSFLKRMRRLGNDTADAWLRTHLDEIGRKSTIPSFAFDAAALPDFRRRTPSQAVSFRLPRWRSKRPADDSTADQADESPPRSAPSGGDSG